MRVPRVHLARRGCRTGVTGLLLAALVLTGCGGQDSGSTESRGDGGSTSTPSPEPSPELKKLNDAWDDFKKSAERLPAKELTLPELTPTKAFSARDVGVFARMAERITLRSIDPELSSMSPGAAFDHVLDGSFPATIDDARKRLRRKVLGSWAHEAVNLFPREAELGKPEIIDARWQWGENSGTDDAGNAAPILWIGLQTFTRTPVTVAGETYPIVVRRTVQVRGFRPGGGPAWWPAVDFDSYPFGNDGCFLDKGSRLVPTRRADRLLGDLKYLDEWLSPQALTPGSKASKKIFWPNYVALDELRKKHSPAELRATKAKAMKYCQSPTP